MWCVVKILVVQSIYVLLKKFQDVHDPRLPSYLKLGSQQTSTADGMKAITWR